jgi:hypothetical protein
MVDISIETKEIREIRIPYSEKKNTSEMKQEYICNPSTGETEAGGS